MAAPSSRGIGGGWAKVSSKLAAYLELTRPHNLLVSAITTAIGYVTAAAAESAPLLGRTLLYAVAAVVLVAAGGYVVNDYYDVETDSIVKPYRPIPSGRVSPREAYILALALLAAGVAAAVPLGAAALYFAAVNAVLVYMYSAYIKRTGLLGNILVALNSAATILMGGLAYAATRGDMPGVVAVPALVAFLLVLGREIVKGIEDYEGDREACYFTLAVSKDPLWAARAAAALLILVAAVSVVPPILGPYRLLYDVLAAATDVLVLYSALSLLKTKSSYDAIKLASRLRSLLKVAFLTGGLAFLLGPLY